MLLDDHKELVLALAESQTSDVASFDDIIEGKGYGLNMLLQYVFCLSTESTTNRLLADPLALGRH